jgi:hypothetical protein
MAGLDQLPGQMMGRRACLHADETRRQLLEEPHQLATPEPPRDGQLAHIVDAMRRFPRRRAIWTIVIWRNDRTS